MVILQDFLSGLGVHMPDFFVAFRHAVGFVFHRLGYHALLVVPRSCLQVLLNECHCSMIVGHSNSKKIYSLIFE